MAGPPGPPGASDKSARRLLLGGQFLNAEVAKPDGAMIALQENRAGFADVAVDFAARGAVALDLVVNLFAVEGHADLIADDRGLGGLPLAARLGRELGRGLESVDGAVAVNIGLAALVIAQDLNFMAAAEVKAAVRSIRHHEFVAHGEVPELLVGHEIGAMFALVHRVLEHSLFDRPAIMTFWTAEFPAGHVLPVEERHEAVLISGANVEGGQRGERQERKGLFHLWVREWRRELSSHFVWGLALPRS